MRTSNGYIDSTGSQMWVLALIGCGMRMLCCALCLFDSLRIEVGDKVTLVNVCIPSEIREEHFVSAYQN